MYCHLVYSFSIILVNAQHCTVSSATEISSRIWIPGDTVILKNGNWVDQSIVIKAIGTESHPIVFRAETPGLVKLSGNSSISFSGRFIEIMGLYFKDGTLSGKDIVSF